MSAGRRGPSASTRVPGHHGGFAILVSPRGWSSFKVEHLEGGGGVSIPSRGSCCITMHRHT
eukprot:775483-Prorocentrum_lima.AAC.1